MCWWGGDSQATGGFFTLGELGYASLVGKACPSLTAALLPAVALLTLRPAAKVGVNVSYSRGMDIVGEIHYDWPLESTLEVCSWHVQCD